jgi:hypothetical protein
MGILTKRKSTNFLLTDKTAEERVRRILFSCKFSSQGERPYGLGMVGRGIDAVGNFFTGLFSSVTADKKTVDEWKKMQSSGVEEKKM